MLLIVKKYEKDRELLQGLFETISEELFRRDISSTALRQKGIVLPAS